jgi:hypothetical protein
LHQGAHGNADLVAHFFRRAFGILRQSGALGLIATNTIGQGDTRATGLATILRQGGRIFRATKRYQWPNEGAAVVVSIVHLQCGGEPIAAVLDDRSVGRISAYLVAGDLDDAPSKLADNTDKAFQGSTLLGMGFTFDDAAAAKGEAESVAEMRRLIETNPRNAERIKPYIGGEEVNNSATYAHHRYAIDFEDFPLRRDPLATHPWNQLRDDTRRAKLRSGIVSADYPGPVAADWPELLEIVDKRVRSFRSDNKRERYVNIWWQYAERRPGLKSATRNIEFALILSRISPQLAIGRVAAKLIFAESLVVLGPVLS